MHTHHTTTDYFDRLGFLKAAIYLVNATCAADARLRAWRLLCENYADEFVGTKLCAVWVRTGPAHGLEGRRRGRRALRPAT